MCRVGAVAVLVLAGLVLIPRAAGAGDDDVGPPPDQVLAVDDEVLFPHGQESVEADVLANDRPVGLLAITGIAARDDAVVVDQRGTHDPSDDVVVDLRPPRYCETIIYEVTGPHGVTDTAKLLLVAIQEDGSIPCPQVQVTGLPPPGPPNYVNEPQQEAVARSGPATPPEEAAPEPGPDAGRVDPGSGGHAQDERPPPTVDAGEGPARPHPMTGSDVAAAPPPPADGPASQQEPSPGGVAAGPALPPPPPVEGETAGEQPAGDEAGASRPDRQSAATRPVRGTSGAPEGEIPPVPFVAVLAVGGLAVADVLIQTFRRILRG